MKFTPRLVVLLAFYLTTMEVAWGCSEMPPCGVKIDSLTMTEIPGIVHIDVGKYDSCSDDFDFESIAWAPLSQVTLEVDYNSNTVRSEEDGFVADPIDGYNTYGMGQPTLDQSVYEIDFDAMSIGSDTVTVKGTIFDDDTVMVHLPGFYFNGGDVYSLMYEGVTSFYSRAMQRLYFLYIDSAYVTVTVICRLDVLQGSGNEAVSCDTEYPEFIDVSEIDKSVQSARVYDDFQMVGLPVVCCLCFSHNYYVFDESTIVRKIALLSWGEIDSRIDTAYRTGGGYGSKLEIDVTANVTSVSGETVIDTLLLNKVINQMAQHLLEDDGKNGPQLEPTMIDIVMNVTQQLMESEPTMSDVVMNLTQQPTESTASSNNLFTVALSINLLTNLINLFYVCL